MIDLLDFSVAEAILAAGVLLTAAYIRGLTGFGFSAVLVAGLSFVVDPAEAVALAIIYEVSASVLQAPGVWKEISWGPFGALLAAAVVGNPIGVWILTNADPDTLRIFVFVAILVLTGGLLAGKTSNLAPSLGMFFAVGVLAGIVNGATALAGLVIVLGMSFMKVAPIELRATLIAYFFASDLVVLVLLAAQGQLTSTEFWRIVIGFPLLVLGIVVGSRTFSNISVERFRQVTLWLLLALAFAGLVRTVAL